jgi:hypothetical protein
VAPSPARSLPEGGEEGVSVAAEQIWWGEMTKEGRSGNGDGLYGVMYFVAGKKNGEDFGK